MGITASQLISDIRNIATSGSNPSDFRISDEQILYWVNEMRSMLISQAIQKHQDYSDVWLQPITCLTLSQVDSSDCCKTPTKCFLLKSDKQIPKTIETDNDNLIISVSGIDGSYIRRLNRYSSKYVRFNKFTAQDSGWYLKDNYIYIVNNQLLQNFNLVGIFENPKDLQAFTNCAGTTCWSLDNDYPVSAKMAQFITDIVIQKRIHPYLLYPQDLKNDSVNMTPPVPQQGTGIPPVQQTNERR